jgi:DNA-binding MarR family transcriptional regulator
MGHRPTQKEKGQRAFQAYLALLDTADWMRGYMRRPLEMFGLTMEEFRLLLMLHHEGPMSITVAAEKRACCRQNIHMITVRMEGYGWVRRKMVTLPPVELQESHIPRAKRDQSRTGRQLGIVHLTPAGKRLIGEALLNHAKVVKSLMRVLDYRQQGTLSEVCRKLRAGDSLKFLKELIMDDVAEDLMVVSARGKTG